MCKFPQMISICYLTVHPAQRLEPHLISRGGKRALHKGAFVGDQ